MRLQQISRPQVSNLAFPEEEMNSARLRGAGPIWVCNSSSRVLPLKQRDSVARTDEPTNVKQRKGQKAFSQKTPKVY